MTIGEILESFLRIPERATNIESGIRFVAESLSNVQTLLSTVHKTLHREKPDPTFVYLLPPDVTQEPPSHPALLEMLSEDERKPHPVRAPFYAQCVRLERGKTTSIPFTGYYDCPPGLWVVVVGPAFVKGVRIGNMSQEGVADFAGHVCKTRDRWLPGVHLTVHLEGV